MKDIENIKDIKVFVDAFYTKVRADELLGPVFAIRIESEAWEKHLNQMYSFWNTVLFFQRTYKGNPFSKHVNLPVEKLHFSRWLSLFKDTIDLHFKGAKAEETKSRADKMAVLFMSKIQHLRENPNLTSLF